MIQESGSNGITIKDVGPNELVEIPLPAEGGITVLRGRNDRGKSEALKAVSVLAGGKDRISVRRDAPPGTKGKITGRGVTVVIHKNVRRTGTAEFEVLDGDLSIEDIVDPGIKDPLAADAKRIKALLRVSNATISPKEFYDLCGGKEAFAEAVGPDAAFDPLLVASKVRAYLHKEARDAETDSQAMANRAAGLRQACQGLDLSASSDPVLLQSRLEAALATHTQLLERDKAAAGERQRYEEAQQQLQLARDEYDGLPREEAKQLEEQALQTVLDQQARAGELREELDQALDELERVKQLHERASLANSAAANHQRTMQRLETVVERGTPVVPSGEEIATASEELATARQALEHGAKIRDAHKHLEEAAKLTTEARELTNDADLNRVRADQVSTVLNTAVASLGVKLVVHEDRLTVPQGGGSFKFFDELSMGARRKIALDIAIDAIGPTGLIPLSQESWEGLDFAARREIKAHLISRQVNMVTAEADQVDDGAGGNVRATVYEGE